MYATRAARASFARCPHCDQLMPPVRFGVKMWPQSARILDLIHAAGWRGIEARELFARAYKHKGRHKPSFKALGAQIREIRKLLVGTRFAIRCYHTERRLWIYTLVEKL